MINAMKIAKKDNVIVAIEHIKKGDNISFKDDLDNVINLVAQDDIRIYHKIAACDINKDEFVIKYQEHIGKAQKDIKQGEHVHDHNVQDCREDLEKLA